MISLEKTEAYRDAVEVPRNYNIIFGDVLRYLKPGVYPIDLRLATELLGASGLNRSILYFDSLDVGKPMFEVIKSKLNGNSKTKALIFPGEGGKAVYEENALAEIGEAEKFFVPTKRNFSGSSAWSTSVSVFLPDQLVDALQNGSIESILIIDDVIASGGTVRTLRQAIKNQTKNELDFTAIAWFGKNQSVEGFQSIETMQQYVGAPFFNERMTPPFNSLSTWLRDNEKSRAVLDAYTQKYVRYPYGFKKQLERIRQLTVL